MYHTLFFGLLTLVNSFHYLYFNRKIKHEKSLSLFFHLYFCVMSSFVYKNNDLIECSTIYFITDSFINMYFKVFKTFNMFHHIFVLTLIYYHKNLDINIINLIGIQEISTIVLCLIDMRIINKRVFEVIFPISFVLFRIVIFNYKVIWYIYYNYTNIGWCNYIVLVLLNAMNIGIVIKMKLLHKIYKYLLNI